MAKLCIVRLQENSFLQDAPKSIPPCAMVGWHPVWRNLIAITGSRTVFLSIKSTPCSGRTCGITPGSCR
eukprot:6487803-Amphidinium_carterae.1